MEQGSVCTCVNESCKIWGMKGRRPKAKRDLYWVTTRDHGEDWFILASTAQAARRYHTEYEGYSPGDTHAELILREVASQISGPMPRHAQLADLRKLGFEVLNPDPHERIA